MSMPAYLKILQNILKGQLNKIEEVFGLTFFMKSNVVFELKRVPHKSNTIKAIPLKFLTIIKNICK